MTMNKGLMRRWGIILANVCVLVILRRLSENRTRSANDKKPRWFFNWTQNFLHDSTGCWNACFWTCQLTWIGCASEWPWVKVAPVPTTTIDVRPGLSASAAQYSSESKYNTRQIDQEENPSSTSAVEWSTRENCCAYRRSIKRSRSVN